MTQQTMFSPACPACRSPETEHEVADRHQCQNCGYRFLIDDYGNIRDFMPWTTAGRKRNENNTRSPHQQSRRLASR